MLLRDGLKIWEVNRGAISLDEGVASEIIGQKIVIEYGKTVQKQEKGKTARVVEEATNNLVHLLCHTKTEGRILWSITSQGMWKHILPLSTSFSSDSAIAI